MKKFICETKNLSKKYKDFYALKNVNLTIPKGEIYGLVGENGAGKTTLIRLLTGLNFKSEGEIILFGHTDNLQYERAKIGCTIEMPALYKDMTASQNLEVQRIQRGIPNKKCIADTLELIGLSNAGKKRVANFSLGMKQRLALGVALLGEPEFLILDEPVNGLDPTGIIELRELLKKLVKEREVTILISSHILSELHQLATCYGFLHKGELLKQISAEKLNEECKRHICLRTDNIQKTTLLLEQKGKINNYSVLRTPLTSIQGYLTLLQECENKQEQEQYLKIIKAKTDYLTELVQYFYDLSVLENEQSDVECERIDINRIVTDCLIEKYYEFGEIQPIIQTENSPVWIYGNNLICKRIIENLIVNALRYSDNYIEVSINQKGVFTIKNSTKSLDNIDVNLLFNKFYTADKSRNKGSSGLGLYIVKELLKKIDGKIENVSYEGNILSISICFPLYNDKKLL